MQRLALSIIVVLAACGMTSVLGAGISFITIGGWGDGGSVQLQVARAMADSAAANPIAFVVSTGNNFVPGGVRSNASFTTAFV